MDPKAYLESLVPSREMIDRFVRPDVNGSAAESDFRAFDADLGWVHTAGVRENSVEGSKGFYSYEPDGARNVVNFADRPCRIHTYGDSFTHGNQVSDGETWQEYLAAHIQEPIRNYGVGGCSVYQAYRRMCRVGADPGAEYIILNIFDDDHFRNLDAWQSIRMDIVPRFTLPHLRVDLGKGTCKEVENPSGTPEAVYDLCDSEFVWEAYQDDPVLKLVVAQVEALRPGVTCAEMYQVGAKAIEDAGLTFDNPAKAKGGSRLGHGQGMLLTEPPSINPRDQTVLEPGVVLSTEPGAMSKDSGVGFLWEDVHVVTDDGHEQITLDSEELREIAF